MKFVFGVAALLALLSCSKQEKGVSQVRTDTVSKPVMASPDSLRADQSTLNSRTSAQAATWRYERTADGLGSPVYKASLTAANTLQFAYPYTGGSTATLTIRRGSGSTNVYIDVSNGQFNRSFQGGTARVRFDGKPAITYSLSAAANGRANIVFFDSERRLIEQIKTAKKASIEIEFPSQKTQTIEFKTAGLKWRH